MNKLNPLIYCLVGIALGAGVMIAWNARGVAPKSGPSNRQSTEPPKSPPTGEQVMLYKLNDVADGAIETAPIREGSISETLVVNGRVAPDANRVAKVGSMMPGRVARLLATVGQRVRAGETLGLIDSVDVGKAQAAYQEAKSRDALAEAELRNTQKIAGAGMFTQKPVDEVQRERAQVASELATMRVAHEQEASTAEAEVKSAESALGRAEAARKLAQAELARRRALVAAGTVQYKPLEDAQREMAEARAVLITGESTLIASESNAKRAERLQQLGTATQREVEVARAAHAEAKATVARAKARAEIAQQALQRELKVFDQKIYATRETESAEAELNKAARDAQEKQAALEQSRRRLQLAQSSQKKAALTQMENRLAALDAMLARETDLAKQNLLGQRAVYEKAAAVARAKIELQAAVNALHLIKVSPSANGAVGIPLVSPIAGVVSERLAQIGQTVDATTTVFTVLDTSRLWIELDLYEKDVTKVSLGQSLRVFNPSAPQWTKEAKVIHVGSSVDAQNRTVTVRAEIAGEASLKPGMFVKAEIVIGAARAGLIVPREAVADEPTGKCVYIEWPDNQGWERHLVIVLASDERQALIKGPAAGEKVATKGLGLVQAAVKTQITSGGGSTTAHTHEH